MPAVGQDYLGGGAVSAVWSYSLHYYSVHLAWQSFSVRRIRHCKTVLCLRIRSFVFYGRAMKGLFLYSFGCLCQGLKG